MPLLPSANVSIDDQSGSPGAGSDYLVVLAPVPLNADLTPRVFVSSAALLGFHGYAPGVDYTALHFAETGKPAIVVPMPIVTAGTISQQDDSQVDGTCVITVTGTPLDAIDAELIVTGGGTIGTDQIKFDLSCDGGRTYKSVKLGTANSYVIPHFGVTLAFAAGDLDVDDVFTFRTSAPLPDQAGIQAAREALAAQLKVERNWLAGWSVSTQDQAEDILDEVNAYETENQRFKLVRVPARAPYDEAKLSNIGTIQFATAGDTIARSAGSFINDGFRVGQTITVAGSVSNNGAKTVTLVEALTLTVSENLTDEGPLAAGVVSITAPAETKPSYVSALEADFEDIASEPRIALGGGVARKSSRIHGWKLRRPFQWAACIREYQHDLHIPTFRKDDDPLSGWDLEDEEGNVVEHDERLDGGLVDAGFGCFRTWANGPRGTFVALDLTRADPNSALSRVSQMNVANLASTVVQAATERAIGRVLVLKSDGTATESSLKDLEAMVNAALAVALLQPRREGPRASSAVWTASRTDDLSGPGATLNGVLELGLLGIIEHVETSVRIN